MLSQDLVTLCAKELRDRIAPLIPRGRPVALVDFPQTSNCGEHAAWLAAKTLLSELELAVAYECSAQSYDRDAMAAKLGDGPILVHGGSKFGERHPQHHEFWLRLLQDFPQNPLIFLPQQATPADEDYLRRNADFTTNHADVTLIARSSVARELFSRNFGRKVRVELAPDLTFILGPQTRSLEPAYDIAWIARTDREQNDRTEAAARLSSQPAEKLPLPRFPDGVELGLVVKQRPPTVLLTDWTSLVFENAEARLSYQALPFDTRSEAYFRRALHILSLGRIVITDRLHGHIFCLLLGIPHVLLDNASGKNSQFYETWTREAGLCRLAKTPAEAWRVARAALPALKEWKDGEWSWTEADAAS
jgi:pyruvyl transferase EpsO